MRIPLPVKIVLATVLGLVALEVGARLYWYLERGVPFTQPDKVLYSFYPQLAKVDSSMPTHEDEWFDILLLGASTLHQDFGQVERELLEQLALKGGHRIRVFNMAVPAHTSRDSYLKYAALGDARFDLVAVYDGINDTRLNNVPPELFREDYSHLPWYRAVNVLAPWHGTARVALPYSLRFAMVSVNLNADQMDMATHQPPPEMARYGKDPRSASTLESHLRGILDLARKRGDPVLLMTFAVHVPANYSLEAFKRKELDYTLHLEPIEIWGVLDDVLRALSLQNATIVRLAGEDEALAFVDQARLMSNEARYFNDPCHLTIVGAAAFARNMIDAILPRLEP